VEVLFAYPGIRDSFFFCTTKKKKPASRSQEHIQRRDFMTLEQQNGSAEIRHMLSAMMLKSKEKKHWQE